MRQVYGRQWLTFREVSIQVRRFEYELRFSYPLPVRGGDRKPGPAHPGWLSEPADCIAVLGAGHHTPGERDTADPERAGRAPDPIDGGYGCVHFCGADDQLPGCRGDVGTLAGWCVSGDCPRPLGGNAGYGQRDRRPGAAFPGWGTAGDGRQHPQYGNTDGSGRLRTVPGCDRARPRGPAGRGRRGGLAVGDGWGAGHIAPTMAERDVGVEDRGTGDVGRPRGYRHRRGAYHCGGAGVYLADAPGPVGGKKRDARWFRLGNCRSDRSRGGGVAGAAGLSQPGWAGAGCHGAGLH